MTCNPATPLTKYDLYERCVQNPAALVPFLVALHGQSPLTLAEDFSGTAALSREWTRTIPQATAHAIDLDPEVITVARKRARDLPVHFVCANVFDALRSPADVLFVGNYSIGYLHSRRDLLAYFARSFKRLNPHGIFVCDTYGGESAFRLGATQRIIPLDPRTRIRYTWEHCKANAFTAMVTNAIHFRVERDGEVLQELTDAFLYRWRLWSVPELVDALHESGFASTEVRESLDASSVSEVPSESFVVTITARKP